jgi:NADH:ubiquinone oxidoreductase subunit 6 (subunit J)
MPPFFIITAVVTLLGAVFAMSLRNLVHCALAMAVAFAGIAGLFLQLDAEFAGFAQILVYVGAIAILVVFAILLTRSGETSEKSVLTSGAWTGVFLIPLVFGILAWTILHTSAMPKDLPAASVATVKNLGDILMTKYVLPLEVIGEVLTVAMIGAVIIALKEDKKDNSGGEQ